MFPNMDSLEEVKFSGCVIERDALPNLDFFMFTLHNAVPQLDAIANYFFGLFCWRVLTCGYNSINKSRAIL